MKYIKMYESLRDPEIEDYIVANEINGHDDLQQFFLNNIGKIRRIEQTIEAEDPDNDYEVEISDDGGVFVVDYEKIIPVKESIRPYLFYKEDILYFSKSKDRCEMFITKNKFNI